MSDPLPQALTPADEFALFQSTDPDKMQKIILHNLREASDFVRKLCRNRFPIDEQFSIAGQCLMNAAKTFAPRTDRDTFIQFARPFLRGAVAQSWREREPVDYGEVIPDKPDSLNPPKPLVDETVDPEYEKIHLAEVWAKIKPYLARLTEAEREIITLHFESGWSLAEVGELLGTTRAAPQQTLSKALIKLRHMLIDDELYYSLR